MTGPDPQALLADVSVVELATGVAGSYCGKALADLGATVTKVEPPDGDAARHLGPFVGGAPHPERSTPFLWLNAGKRSVTLRLEDATDRARLRRLAVGADVLVLDGPTDALASAGIAEAELRAEAPGLVVVRASPFGESGPHAAWRSSPLVQYAMACWMHMTGRPDGTPLASGGLLSEVAPGLAAACAALMALHARDVGGAPGQHIEIAQQELLVLMQPYITLGLAYTGAWRTRTGMPFPMTIVEAADGWLGVNVLTQSQWELLCAFAGETELLADERFATPVERGLHAPELTARFARWAASRPSLDTFVEGQGWRVPLGAVVEVPALAELSQHRARDFFVAVDHPAAGTLRYPRAPFLARGVPAPRRAPLLGEHNAV
ncbi:MAG: CoA transferase, partial [Chloroflexi bacterium]|nr:CoA transferase [Chloroflexota bacterium]